MSADPHPGPPATGSAERVDAKATIRSLAETGFTDGLVGRLDATYGQLSRQAVEDCVAEAVGALYDALAEGRNVKSAEGYVFKAARNLALAEHRRITALENPDDFEDVADDRAHEPSRDWLRAEALRVARHLLPRLGQENVVRVMTMLLDAIESGVPDLSSEEIGDALGLSPDVVLGNLVPQDALLCRQKHVVGLGGAGEAKRSEITWPAIGAPRPAPGEAHQRAPG